MCDIYKNALINLSEIFWSADLILALFLRIFPVSMVLCCRVRACAGSRFGAIPPPFHPKSEKQSGGRYRSRDQGVDFCERARLRTAAAVRKTAQSCQKNKKHRPNGRCFFADAGPAFWSEWRESNSRPLEPHSSALPNCATPGHSGPSISVYYYTGPYSVCQEGSPCFCMFFYKIPSAARLRWGVRVGSSKKATSTARGTRGASCREAPLRPSKHNKK